MSDPILNPSPCKAIIRELWTESMPDFAELPAILWEKPDCSGERWPKIGDHTQFDETIPASLASIGSFYVPPHAMLQLEAKHNGHAHYGGLVTNSSALLDRTWRSVTGEPCPANTETDCGTRIDWADIPSWRVVRRKPWRDYLHHKAVESSVDGSYSLTVRGDTYNPNFDDFMTDFCQSGDPASTDCSCVNEFKALQAAHPNVPLDILRVGLLDSTCNPAKHYIPSTVLRTQNTDQDCKVMLAAMIKAGSYSGGTGSFKCGSKTYDHSAIEAEKTENSVTNNSWLYVLLMVLVYFVLVGLVVWYQVRQLRQNHPSVQKLR